MATQKNKWTYRMDIAFAIPREQTNGHPQGVAMYFKNLSDAFERLIRMNSGAFLRGSSDYDGDKFPITGVPITSVTITATSGQKLLEAKLHTPGTSSNLPDISGIYYTFPQGIAKFEQEAGDRLADFKGYDPEVPHLLVSYLIDDGFRTLEHSTAYKNRYDKAITRQNKNLDCELRLTSYFFGHDQFGPRAIDRHPLHEVFHFDNANESITALLSADFNKLDEDTAWDLDLPSFNNRANVHYRGVKMAELLPVNRNYRLAGKEIVSEPGLHLALYGETESIGLTLDFSKLNRLATLTPVYQIAIYDSEKSLYTKVPDLAKIIGSPILLTSNVKSAARKKMGHDAGAAGKKINKAIRNRPSH